MASSPVYVGTPRTWYAQVSAANTNRDGTGSLATLVTGPAAPGCIITKLRIHATVTTTAGMVRAFLSKDGGTTKRLLCEIPVDARTVSASVDAFSAEVLFDEPLKLDDANGLLYVSTHNAEAINVFAFGGDV